MQTAPAPALPPDCTGRAIDLEAVRPRLAQLSAPERLHWGLETFGEGFAVTTSFGIQSAVLLQEFFHNANIEESWIREKEAVASSSDFGKDLVSSRDWVGHEAGLGGQGLLDGLVG